VSHISHRDLLKLTSILTVLRPDAEVAGSPQDSHIPGGAPVAFETRRVISLDGVRGTRTGEGDLLLRTGETARVEAILPEPLTDVSLRLRLIGEQDLDPQLCKAEGGFTKCYRPIDDALDQGRPITRRTAFSLKSQGEAFPRRAYWRVPWSVQAPARDYILTIWAKTTGRSSF
jgi:hypothetical protein